MSPPTGEGGAVDLLDIAGVAELLGVAPATVRGYRSRGLLPEPDGPYIGGSPAWRRSTIERWRNSRPGRGYRSDLHRELAAD